MLSVKSHMMNIKFQSTSYKWCWLQVFLQKRHTNEAYELFEDMQQSIHIYDCTLNENTNINQY